MNFLEFLMDKVLLPDALKKPKPVSKHQVLEMAARKFFNSPKEADDLFQFTIMANYVLRDDHPLTTAEVEIILLNAAYS